MAIVDTLNGWLPLVGGVSGLAVLAYMGLMIYYARKKDRDIQDLRVQVAELKGIVIGRQKR